MQAPHENPYNGGLIDFHESVLKADLNSALYAQQMAAQNQYQAQFPYQGAPGLPVGAGMLPVNPQMLACNTPNPYATHAANTFLPPQVQAQIPGHSMMMSPAPAQCIAGPPAFLHLHGKVYAPVEESVAATPAAPDPQPRAAVKEQAGGPSAKTFDRMVEKRVEQKVDEFFSKTIKAKAGDKGMKKRNAAGKEDCGLKDLNSAMRSRIRGY